MNPQISKLQAKIKRITEDSFKHKVKKLYASMNDVHKHVQNAMKDYLISNTGRKPFPKKQSGNLLNKIIYKKLKKSDINITKARNRMTATFSIYYGIDTDGTSPLVKTKKRKAPYARYLNYSSLFPEYNGFFDKISDRYKSTFLQETNAKAKEIFKDNGYVYKI